MFLSFGAVLVGPWLGGQVNVYIMTSLNDASCLAHNISKYI